MKTILRVLCALVGLLFLLTWLNWLVNPDSAAAALGMPLLEGAGANTQIGDLTAFFFALALFALVGSWKRSPAWLNPAATLLAAAAVFRLSAWGFHGTQLIVSAVAIEVIGALVLSLYAYSLRPAAYAPQQA